jgi:hypothetical protein
LMRMPRLGCCPGAPTRARTRSWKHAGRGRQRHSPVRVLVCTAEARAAGTTHAWFALALPTWHDQRSPTSSPLGRCKASLQQAPTHLVLVAEDVRVQPLAVRLEARVTPDRAHEGPLHPACSYTGKLPSSNIYGTTSSSVLVVPSVRWGALAASSTSVAASRWHAGHTA